MINDLKVNKYRNKLLSHLGLIRDINSASGNILIDSNGDEIIDFSSQFGALPFGHNPVEFTSTVKEYISTNKPVFIQPMIPESTKCLSKKLCSYAGSEYDYVVFTNSGAETIEASIKLARFKTGRKKVLSVNGGFHGKTYCALSATGSDKYSGCNVVDNDNFDKIEFNNVEQLELSLKDGKYAAFVVEVVQGEGGMHVASRSFMEAAERFCKDSGTVFVIDEVQTGMGRTGKLFSFQNYNIKPDHILLSKALGGGIYPIGALVCKNKQYSLEFDKKHSSTFANGGLASAVALSVLNKIIDGDSVLDGVNSKSEYFKKSIMKLEKKYDDFLSFSGCGLMYAVRFKDPFTKDNYIVNYMQNTGSLSFLLSGYFLNKFNILTLPFLDDSGAIRFEPPLNVSLKDIDAFLLAVETVCIILRDARYDILFEYLLDIDSGLKPLETVSYRRGNKTSNNESKSSRKFAFLMHSTNNNDMARALPLAIREQYSPEAKNELTNWFNELGVIENRPGVIVNISMKSSLGFSVDGVLIYSPIMPDRMMKLGKKEKIKLLDDYMQVAKDEGVSIVGLGAYTSVISRAGQDIRQKDIPLTTGNSFTALATCDSLVNYFDKSNTNKLTAAVIGARGSVGRLSVIDLSLKFKNVILIGSKGSGEKVIWDCLVSILIESYENDITGMECSALRRFMDAAEINGVDKVEIIRLLKTDGEQYIRFIFSKYFKNKDSYPFIVSTNIEDVSSKIDAVISVTSEGKPFLKDSIFKDGTVVFDTSRPFDFIQEKSSKVSVFEGGLVKQPEAVMFGDCNMIGSEAGINLACLSETIALCMEGVNENTSLGKSIPYMEAKFVFEKAIRNGFRPYLKYTEQSKLTKNNYEINNIVEVADS
ncbi:MAG: aminotransferase class III-fold pyridoxal phosphate-dependent enzyme [Colwellia sp.]